jgi:hypothetical protein
MLYSCYVSILFDIFVMLKKGYTDIQSDGKDSSSVFLISCNDGKMTDLMYLLFLRKRRKFREA